MNLLTQKQLADLTGVSSAAITKARKNKRLEYYNGTKQYNIDSPLNKSFLEKIPDQRINGGKIIDQPEEKDEETIDARKQVLNAQKKKLKEELELKRQQRIEKEIKNAVRRGELVEVEMVDKMIMTWFDIGLQTNKRYFSSLFDEIVNKTLEKGERPTELKQKYLNQMEKAADEAKEKACQKLLEIKENIK